VSFSHWFDRRNRCPFPSRCTRQTIYASHLKYRVPSGHETDISIAADYLCEWRCLYYVGTSRRKPHCGLTKLLHPSQLIITTFSTESEQKITAASQAISTVVRLAKKFGDDPNYYGDPPLFRSTSCRLTSLYNRYCNENVEHCPRRSVPVQTPSLACKRA
jgi:hypothetical protein